MPISSTVRQSIRDGRHTRDTLRTGKPQTVFLTEYIQENFRPSDRLAILLRNRAHTVQRIVTAARITERSFEEWLRYKNDRELYDVYVGMSTLKPGASTRTKEDIHTVRHLYLDLDQDGAAAIARIRESSLVLAANYSINTSPGKYQLVWRVENVSPEQAEALLRAMARTFGGDPAATDSTRALRIPGLKNRKYETEFLVKAEKHTDRVYHLLDFPLPSEPAKSDFRPRRQALGSSEPRPLSQSEHDWAYAKRALARGDDPEEIVRRIAAYRADDKHDPLYYARLTVSKAQGESRENGRENPQFMDRGPET
jgi:RepB DNA-primase from phage plasmid